MYYQSQLRNLQREAQLQSRLAGVTIAEDRLFDVNKYEVKRGRNSVQSRREQDQETSIHLQKSRIQAELSASSVSTSAILNRSRIQSALELRHRNQQLQTQREKYFMQQRYYQAASQAAEQELDLQNHRQAELQYIRQTNIREYLYRQILHEESQKIQNEIKQADLTRQLHQEKLRRQITQRQLSLYGSLRRPYLYY